MGNTFKWDKDTVGVRKAFGAHLMVLGDDFTFCTWVNLSGSHERKQSVLEAKLGWSTCIASDSISYAIFPAHNYWNLRSIYLIIKKFIWNTCHWTGFSHSSLIICLYLPFEMRRAYILGNVQGLLLALPLKDHYC